MTHLNGTCISQQVQPKHHLDALKELEDIPNWADLKLPTLNVESLMDLDIVFVIL